jgi:outer membrane immunogenic protein
VRLVLGIGGLIMMKLPALAGAALLFGGPAFAADAAITPATPAFSWTGFYAGGYAGYGWGSVNASGTIDPSSGFGNSAPAAQPAYNANMSPSLKSRGFTGGGTVGANWQMGVFVLGLEGDFGAFDFSDSATTSVTPPGHVRLTSDTKVSADWLGTVRGRLGWSFARSLIYATGGVAFTNLSFRQVNGYVIGSPGDTESFSISNVATGLAAGAGWEYAFAPNWSGKVEYLHLDFGTVSGTGVIPVQPVNVQHSIDLTADVVRAGINYKFGP